MSTFAVTNPNTGEVEETEMERWAMSGELKAPRKRVVASRSVEDGNAVPSEYGVSVLKDAHDQLCRALGIKSPDYPGEGAVRQ